MARVRRIDFSTLKAPTRRSDGTLVADALITRTGVFSYRNPDGTERKEYRPPAQVFDAKALESFKLVPLTDDHPPMMLDAKSAKQYMVGAVGENVRKDGDYVAATIAVHDAVTIAKMDAGKTQVSCGYDCELDETPGVAPDGTRYDAVQTNIVGNHLAIVANARAGAAAAVRMDAAMMVGGAPQAGSADDPNGPSGGVVSAPTDDDDDDDMGDGAGATYDDGLTAEERGKLSDDDFAVPESRQLPIKDHGHVIDAMARFGKTVFKDAAEKKTAFHKIVARAKALGIDSSGFEKKWSGRLDERNDSMTPLEKALADLNAANQALGAANSRSDAAEAKVKALETERAKLEGERDGARTSLTAAEKARKDAEDGIAPRVKARVALQASAAALFGADAKYKRADGAEVTVDQLSDREIRLAVVKHVDGVDVDNDDAGKRRDDVYVDARFDAAMIRAQKSAATFQGAMAVIQHNRMDATGGDELAKERAKTEKARQDMIERNRNGWMTPEQSATADGKGK